MTTKIKTKIKSKMGNTYLFDFKEMIPCSECSITTDEKRFVRYFMEKLYINFDEDEVIILDDTNPIEFGHFLLTIMREYEYYLHKMK